MAQPPPYDRAFNFADYQAVNPTNPLPGLSVDEELARVKLTLDAVLSNLAIIQRDDTALANKTVGFDQLKDEVQLGFNAPTEWAPEKNYIVRDTVFYDTRFYRCLESHVSSSDFEADLNAGLWAVVADFTIVQTTAIAARDAAIQAQADAEAAQQASEDARDDAIVAKNLAEGFKDDAEAARDAAAGSASSALSSASAASASASTAGTHASNASNSASAASSSASAANNAKVAAENARDASVAAQGLAEAAQAGAEQAQADAEAAQSSAGQYAYAASLAQSGAESARDVAIGAKDDALLAKSDAESARDAAVVAQGLAEAAQADAEAARDDAISARNAAQSAQTGAENAADRAEAAASGVEYPVSYAPQTLDSSERAQARANIGLGNSATRNVGTTSGTVAAGNDSRILSAMLNKGTLGQTDLNTIGAFADNGVYYQTTNAEATSQRNYPIQRAGTLIVTPAAFGCMQMYLPYNPPGIFVRGLTGSWNGSGPWGEWREVVHTNRTISTGTGLTGGGTLAADLEIALDSTSLASLARADAAVSYAPQTLSPAEQSQARANIDALGPEETPDRAFRQGNILGTVSQSSGVPTGAIIERGSNANGEYVRYADGTQICWRNSLPASSPPNIAAGDIFRNDGDEWTYPASFVGPVSAGLSGAGANVRWATHSSSGNMSDKINVSMYSAFSSDTIGAYYGLYAFGRWF